MNPGRTISRATLLVLSMLSACAANDFGNDETTRRSDYTPSGAFGDYLTGRYAARLDDMDLAADNLEKAARLSGVPEVQTEAFMAAVMAGRPEATRLAAQVPDNAVAGLVLADADAKAGRWSDAEGRFAKLPQQGLTQILRPLLVAWAQAGAGHTAAALATLQPFVDGGRLRGVMALHSALIADLGNQPAEAARLYRLAQVDYGALNLRLGMLLASWQARQGHLTDAQAIIRELTASNGDLAIARRALEADVGKPVVRNASDGIAEAYLAMGATLKQQNANEPAQAMIRLALSMRPDFTAARLLLADVQAGAQRSQAALDTLEPVPSSDPLYALVQLRRAGLEESLGQTDASTRLLEKLASEYPDQPEPLALAGSNLRQAGRFSEAATMFTRAIDRVGTPTRSAWPLFYERGVAYDRAGQWSKAESDFDYALRLAPDQPSVMNYLAYAWTEQDRNLPQAKQMLERAVEQNPNEAAYVDSLGWVELRQGDTAGALRNLNKAVELQPEDAVINGHLGDALAAVGRIREAEYQWRRALTLKPDPADAERINARLNSVSAAKPKQAAGQASDVR